MGPVTLFDKSFLQSLSLDESVLFDHLFQPIVSPLFFVETLADLAKQRSHSSRTPEEEVRIIADKTPVASGVPCLSHSELCIANLLGHRGPQLGQIPIAGARPVRGADGKAGAVVKRSPEAEAFSRWQHERFQDIERDMAADWRLMLSQLNLPEVARRMRALGITPKTCRTVQEAHGIAASLVHAAHEPEEQLALLAAFTHLPPLLHSEINYRWGNAGFPPLATYAPYAAHVLKVEIFFQIALAANLISADRPSNRADIAYLFYLPFAHVFVSGDRLHRLCTAPFLKSSQDFVWAPDLKRDLGEFNADLMARSSEKDREKGLHRLAPRPLPGSVVDRLWQKHAPGLHSPPMSGEPLSPEAQKKLIEYFNSFHDAATAPEVADLPMEELQSMSIERRVPARKGSWWIVPKKIADEEDAKRSSNG